MHYTIGPAPTTSFKFTPWDTCPICGGPGSTAKGRFIHDSSAHAAHSAAGVSERKWS